MIASGSSSVLTMGLGDFAVGMDSIASAVTRARSWLLLSAEAGVWGSERAGIATARAAASFGVERREVADQECLSHVM